MRKDSEREGVDNAGGDEKPEKEGGGDRALDQEREVGR